MGSESKRSGGLASFETLLEQIIAEVARGGDEGLSSHRRALHRIASFFDAASIEVRSHCVPGGVLSAGEGEAASAPVEVDLFSDAETGPATAVLIPRRGAPLADRDVSRLRIASWTVVESLRRRNVESRNRDKKLWLLTALQAAEIGIWDWEVPEDRVNYATPYRQDGVASLSNRTTAAEWFEQTHPEDIAISRPLVDKAISGEADSFAMVVRMRRLGDQAGAWRRIYSRGRVVERDESGRARRLVGTFEDVTSAGESFDVQARRDAAMERAARMASLGALASSLAHELNQPLAALTSFLEGSAQLLEKENPDAPQIVGAIDRSVELAHEAASIVKRFRRVLKREAPLKESVHVVTLLRSVRADLERDAADFDVRIEVTTGDEPLEIRVDRTQIQQALINLGRNALEAVRAAGRQPGVVTLEARRREPVIEIRVTDDGPGIPQERASRLFEPFASEKGPGRGLGLVVSLSIAELHGGRIWLERTGPGGSTFVLELPASDDGGS